MKMKKKLMTALTVAAIAGTCALSGTALAAFTANAPVRANADLNAVTIATTTKDLYTVGSDGMVYRTAKADLYNVSVLMTHLDAAIAKDIVDSSPAANGFVAITGDGTLVTYDSTATPSMVVKEADATTKAILAADPAVGIVYLSSAGDPYIVTAKGDLFSKAALADASWTRVTTLSAAVTADASVIKGIALGADAETHLYPYGQLGTTNAINVYSFKIADSSITKSKITACPTVNALDVDAKDSWTAAGSDASGNAVIVRGVADLQSSNADIATASALATGTLKKLNDVTYDPSETYGFAAGETGTIVEIIGATATAKTSTGATDQLNGVAVAYDTTSGLRRTFVAGDKGVVKFGDNNYWTPASALATAINPVATIASNSKHFASGSDNKVYQYNPTANTWVVGSIATTAATAPGLITATSGGADYVAYRIDNDNTGVVKVDTTTPSTPVTLTASATPLQGYAIFDGKIISIGKTETTTPSEAKTDWKNLDGTGQSALTDSSTIGGASTAVTSVATTANGLYAVKGATVFAMVTSGGTDLAHTVVAENVYADAEQLTLVSDASSLLFTLADGLAMITGDNVFIATDGSGTVKVADGLTVSSAIALPANWGAGSILSGSRTNLFYTAGTNVWHMDTTATTPAWEKYDTPISTTSTLSAVNGISSVGASVLAIDTAANTLAYSTGSGFTSAALPGSGTTVVSDINSVYNATSTTVYAGGRQGTLYSGAVSPANVITWTKVASDDIGTYNVKDITGYGAAAYALYGPESGAVSIALKDATNNFVAQTVKFDSVALAADDYIKNIRAIDADTLCANLYDASLSKTIFVKGDLASGTINFKSQLNTADNSNIVMSNVAYSADGKTIYGADETNLIVLTNESSNKWTVTKHALAATVAGSLQVHGTTVYASTDKGIYSFDGTTVTLLRGDFRHSFAPLKDCWSYDNVIFTTDTSGYVYSYNVLTKVSTQELVSANTSLNTITGSGKGSYLIAAGNGGVLEINTINRAGGGEKTTSTTGGAGEDQNLIATSDVPEVKNASYLNTNYNIPADINVISEIQSFTTKTLATDGETHVFAYNFTPTSKVAVNDLTLYKCLGAEKSYTTYSRVSTAPVVGTATSGTYWLVNAKTGTVMGSGDDLAAGTTYTCNFAIEDNTIYDIDKAPKSIKDPVILGTSSSSSSSSSGCVFNPAQSFGLEWLLLMFAPMVAIIRNKFKK